MGSKKRIVAIIVALNEIGCMAKFTDEQKKERVNAIISDIYDGITLKEALKRNNTSSESFGDWIEELPDLALRYARAEKILSDIDADEVVNVAFAPINPNSARNMMEALKWRASKRNPKKYGDRIDHHVTGQIDLKAAIEEAHSRVVIPSRYSETIEDAQLTDNKQITHDESTGYTPVSADNSLPDSEALEKMRRDLLS